MNSESAWPAGGVLRRLSSVNLRCTRATGTSIRVMCVPGLRVNSLMPSGMIVNAIPGVSGAFVLFSSASSAVFLFIYILTLLAHRRYRRSADFIPDGFVMPAWKVLNTVAIVFFVFIYLTLFLADDTRNSAIAGLVWLVGFGGFSMLRERYRSRDLKAALEHKE